MVQADDTTSGPVDPGPTGAVPPRTDEGVPPAPVTGPAVPSDPGLTTEGPAPRPQRARRRRRRRIIVWSTVAVLVVASAGVGLVAAHRIDRPLGQPTVSPGRVATTVVPGTPPVLPWPAAGQAAVAVPALHYAVQSGPEQPVPVASLTKMTTALVVLLDHPVPPGTSGPTITVTPDDAAQFDVDLDNDETNIPLEAGEALSELQLVEALLNQSANDAAYTLAAWDAGTQQAFVAKMNALASSLGAADSRYVDASGFDPRSVSTAADTLRIAAAGMAIPTFASVAGMPTVDLPGVGTVRNIVTAIGSDGIVGVKSGYTSQASGCMVLAGYRSVDGRSVLVLASALGQREPEPSPRSRTTTPPGATSTTAPTTTTTTAPYSALEAKYPLRYTEPIVAALLHSSEAGIVAVPLVTAGHAVGTASTDWAGVRRVVPVVAMRSATLLGVPGQQVSAAVAPTTSPGATPDEEEVGTVRFTLGSEIATVPVRLDHRLPEPDWWWKVLHNP